MLSGLKGVKELQKLKEHLCKAPILYSPNFTKPFILQTDASDQRTGAVLSQNDDETQSPCCLL